MYRYLFNITFNKSKEWFFSLKSDFFFRFIPYMRLHFQSSYRTLLVIALIVLSLICYSCAVIVAPSGGEPDKTPPVIVNCQPLRHNNGYIKRAQ